MLSPVLEGPRAMMETLDRLAREEALESRTELDLQQYQAVGFSGPFRLHLGRQQLPESNLVLARALRRGFSVGLQGGPREAVWSAFILQARDQGVAGRGLGLDDPENRVVGMSGEMIALRRGASALRVGGASLFGSRPEYGLEGDEAPGGSAWSVWLRASLGPHLHIGGELARSRYHDPWSAEAEEGSAVLFQAGYQDTYAPEGAKPLHWSVDLERVSVDPSFYSLGNPYEEPDREEIRLNARIQQGPLNLQGLVGRYWNALDAPSDREIGQRLYLLLGYAPGAPLEALSFLGHPSWRLIYENRRSEPEAASMAGSLNRNLQYRFAFRRDRWRWEAGWGLRFYALEDRSYVWLARTADLQAEGRLGRRIVLKPGLQMEQASRTPAGEESETVSLRLRGHIDLVPHWLKGKWNLSLEQSESYAGTREQTAALDGEVIYSWLQPRRDRPGFDLSLRGSRRQTRYMASAAEDQVDYQLWLGLTMKPPSA